MTAVANSLPEVDLSRVHARQPRDALVAILMTGILLLGLLRRERHGFGGIGFESAIVLVLYAGSAAVLLT